MALPPQFLKKKSDNKAENEKLGLHGAHAKSSKDDKKKKAKKDFYKNLANKKD